MVCSSSRLSIRSNSQGEILLSSLLSSLLNFLLLFVVIFEAMSDYSDTDSDEETTGHETHIEYFAGKEHETHDVRQDTRHTKVSWLIFLFRSCFLFSSFAVELFNPSSPFLSLPLPSSPVSVVSPNFNRPGNTRLRFPIHCDPHSGSTE